MNEELSGIELPGMWEEADFLGGATDTHYYKLSDNVKKQIEQQARERKSQLDRA